RFSRDWSTDVCSSDLHLHTELGQLGVAGNLAGHAQAGTAVVVAVANERIHRRGIAGTAAAQALRGTVDGQAVGLQREVLRGGGRTEERRVGISGNVRP